ncbi:MAG: HDOD domain-containing protein [Phycisphaerae bacterium]|nr:HDOD domain-containing protein [Phycisphaerae bacterium]
MGLWNWIVGGRSKTSDNTTATEAKLPAHESPEAGAAVSTLEPPGSPEESAEQQQSQEPPWWAPEDATVTEPQAILRPELSTETRALENALVSHFDGHDLDLPAMPRVPEQVLRHLQDPMCDFGRLAGDIAEDQVIAAAVIRMANSPLYRGSAKIVALKPAINRLGANALRTLMLNLSLRAITDGGKGGDQALAKLIRQRSLAAATIMRGLSAFTTVDAEEAFSIGLLHDIGNVVVLREARKQQRHLGYQIDIDTFEYLCFECHQEFGELIAIAWSLPSNLRAFISDHHCHPQEDDPLRTERLLLQLTGMICALLGYAPWTSYDLLSSRVVQDLALPTQEDFRAFLSRLPDEVDEMIDFL